MAVAKLLVLLANSFAASGAKPGTQHSTPFHSAALTALVAVDLQHFYQPISGAEPFINGSDSPSVAM